MEQKNQFITRLTLGRTTYSHKVVQRLLMGSPALGFCSLKVLRNKFTFSRKPWVYSTRRNHFCLFITSYDAKWRHLTRHVGSAILKFTIFLKNTKKSKIKPGWQWNLKIPELFWNLKKATKKIRNMFKKLIHGQTYTKFALAMAMSKIMKQLTQQSFR